MLVPLFLLSCSPAQKGLDVKELDRLAQARDVAGLQRFVDGAAPLSVLKTNGAYEGGKYGWRAFAAVTPAGRRYVVLSTYLTGEDVGELLFVEDRGRLRYLPETEPFRMRVVREDLAAEFDLPKRSVKIVAKVALEALRQDPPPFAGPLREFTLRLGPNFCVATVKDGQGKPVPFVQAGGIVFVDAPIVPQTLTLTYSGVVDKPEYAGSIDGEHIQLSNESWYPTIARGPAPYTFAAKIPEGWTAVGQGEGKSGGGVATFDMALPTSVWSFSAEPFRTFTRKGRSGALTPRLFDVYSRTLPPEDARRQTELAEPILAFYESKFAPYPFTRWGVADVPTYGGGALEAYSFATYGAGTLIDEDAHEPSHTWWGGLMPNTYLRSFWNESFAVYSEGLFRREAPIGNVPARRAAFADLALNDPAYARVPVAEGSCFVGPEASALGYGKGAHVLAMLEDLVGTDRMTEGMKAWIVAHAQGQYAEWQGFEDTMNARYPEFELRGFFDFWLRKPGVLEVTVRDVRWDGARVVGVLGAGTPRMPLEFVLVGANGRIERRTLDTRSAGPDGAFSLPSSIGKPARVLFDPYHRALRKGAPLPPTGVFETIRDWRVYRDPRTPGYLEVPGTKVEALPADLDRTVLVGDPRTTPAMAPLLAKAGMTLAGDSLTWNGTTVDLRTAGAAGLVDLGGGKRCAIVLGTARPRPNVGRASVALWDALGRFLTGETPLPETAGRGPESGVFEIP